MNGAFIWHIVHFHFYFFLKLPSELAWNLYPQGNLISIFISHLDSNTMIMDMKNPPAMPTILTDLIMGSSCFFGRNIQNIPIQSINIDNMMNIWNAFQRKDISNGITSTIVILSHFHLAGLSRS